MTEVIEPAKARARRPIGVAGRTTAPAGLRARARRRRRRVRRGRRGRVRRRGRRRRSHHTGRRASTSPLVAAALLLGLRAPGPIRSRVRDRHRARGAAGLVLRLLRRRQRGREARLRGRVPAHVRELRCVALPPRRGRRARAIFLAGALLVLRQLGGVRGRRRRQLQRRPVPERDQRLVERLDQLRRPRRPVVVVLDQQRHHRQLRHRGARHRARVPRASAPRSTGAATPAPPRRSSRSVRSRRSPARSCSVGTTACCSAACSPSPPVPWSGSSAATATDDARPRGSACSRCSAGASRSSPTSRPAAPPPSAASRFGFALVLGSLAWWLAPGARRARRRRRRAA